MWSLLATIPKHGQDWRYPMASAGELSLTVGVDVPQETNAPSPMGTSHGGRNPRSELGRVASRQGTWRPVSERHGDCFRREMPRRSGARVQPHRKCRVRRHRWLRERREPIPATEHEAHVLDLDRAAPPVRNLYLDGVLRKAEFAGRGIGCFFGGHANAPTPIEHALDEVEQEQHQPDRFHNAILRNSASASAGVGPLRMRRQTGRFRESDPEPTWTCSHNFGNAKCARSA